MTIASEDVGIQPMTWVVIDKINIRTTMTFTVIDLNNLTAITKGNPIAFARDGTTIFNGFVDTVTITEVEPDILFYYVSAVDNCSIADRRLIVVSLTDELAGDIVTDYILPILAEEGVTAGTIDDGAEITKTNFNYYTCTQALDALSDITGFYWNIDFDKKLHFANRAANLSDTALDSDLKHKNFTQAQQNREYRNVQYLRAGLGETSEQEDEEPTPKPDSISRTFAFSFPMAQEPTIETNIAAGGWAEKTIGLKNVDTGKDWYWEYNSEWLTQDDAGDVLTAADAIRGTYIGLKQLLTVSKRQSEVNARQATEGGTGQYEHLIKNTDLNTSGQADEFTTGLLDKYARINNRITTLMYTNTFSAGELVNVTKSAFGIDNVTYLVNSVRTFPKSFSIEGYQVELLDGSDYGGWEELFKRLINGNKSISLSENEVVVRIISTREEHTDAGVVYINPVESGLFPSNTLYPSATLYPDETYGSYDEVLND